MIKRITLLLAILPMGVALFAQSSKGDEYFKYENYNYALEEFLNDYEEDAENYELNYKIGVCYLNTNIDKAKAIPYLEKVLEAKRYNPDLHYLLGSAYHYAYRFDEAIAQYTKFKENGKGSIENIMAAPRKIEQCSNAKELMKFPVDVTFINLGKEVNSSYDDYYPFVPINESYIVYNSRREDESVQKDNGEYFSNTYISKVVDGEYQKAKLTLEINSEKTDDEVVGLNSEGTKIVYYKEDFRGVGDLHLADFSRGGRASDDVILGPTINSKYSEIAGALSDDGKKFFFASDREGGYGGIDLYMCQVLPNGEWSDAMNLGPSINTPYDEDFPNIYNDGTILYFSSKGHSSMGGYDVFKATWDEDLRKFTKVENLGYPINTPEDNMNFRLSDDGKYGYMAALRKEGLGGLDIYRINFNIVEPKYTVIRGEISAENAVMPDRVDIFVYDENGDLYGDYKPNMQSQKYVIILPAGNYEMEIESEGFESIQEKISVKDKVSYKPELIKDIVLKKK